jgi:hypothetical protein
MAKLYLMADDWLVALNETVFIPGAML